MSDIQLTYHKETDADNRWCACNNNTHSSSRKHTMSDTLYETILGKEKKDVMDIILQHIDKEFGSIDMDKVATDLSSALEKDKDEYINKMEIVTKHKLPYDKITCFITTLPRCPYHWQKGLIWLWYKADDPVRVVLHEMLHFQFHRRYRNNPKVKLLSEDQFEDLKESLTFLLNHEFKSFIEFPDTGYEVHQQLRGQLETYRLSQPENERDFEKLIEYGVNILLSH